LLLVAIVRRPHGRTGEVSVEPITSFPERFRPGMRLIWQKGDERRTLNLSSVRSHGHRLLLAFEGRASIDEARELSGGDLSVPGDEAFPTPKGFYYSHELAGWRCEDGEGKLLGMASGLEQTPAGPLLSVDSSTKEVLVPFVSGIVVALDRTERRIVLDPPEGLFDL
jgi:16S rRNA processing protein RimM